MIPEQPTRKHLPEIPKNIDSAMIDQYRRNEEERRRREQEEKQEEKRRPEISVPVYDYPQDERRRQPDDNDNNTDTNRTPERGVIEIDM